jgi:PPOX class probable F420-dependent enzyme
MLPEEILYQLLDTMPVARLGLIDDKKRPESLPIVFARVGGFLFSPIDGKPKSSTKLARIEHIKKEPKGSLLLDYYADDWEQLWWVKLDTEAQVVLDEHVSWGKAVSTLRDKYSQYREVSLFTGEPTMIAIRWTRVRWWASDGLNGLNRWLDDHRLAKPIF